jgi:hypothetical protein
LAAAGLVLGCSLLVEQRSEQCTKDADCAKFAGTVCEAATHVCVPKSGGSTGSGGCEGDQGCYSCTPHSTDEFLNACTEASCVPFDNAALKKYLSPDGGLPKLPQ